METNTNIIKNKRGVIDLLFIIVGLLVVVISCAAIITVFKEFTNEADKELFQYNNETLELKNDMNRTLNAVDYIIATLWIFLIIGASILAYQLRTAQYFIPIAIIIIVFMVIISALLSNVWHKIQLSDSLTLGINELGFSSFILGYLPIWTLVIGCIIMFITYALGGEDEGY